MVVMHQLELWQVSGTKLATMWSNPHKNSTASPTQSTRLVESTHFPLWNVICCFWFVYLCSAVLFEAINNNLWAIENRMYKEQVCSVLQTDSKLCANCVCTVSSFRNQAMFPTADSFADWSRPSMRCSKNEIWLVSSFCKRLWDISYSSLTISFIGATECNTDRRWFCKCWNCSSMSLNASMEPGCKNWFKSNSTAIGSFLTNCK